MAEPQAAQQPLAREYETIYVLRADIPTESARRIASRVEEVTAREGGKLTQVETWGRRTLAYPMRNLKRGVYVYVKYVGNGVLVSELERNLRMLDDVLRFQTVKVREGLDVGAVAVNPEEVKFEEIVPPTEAEEEESIERALGLEPRPERERPEHEPPSRSGDALGEDAEEGAEADDEDEDDE